MNLIAIVFYFWAVIQVQSKVFAGETSRKEAYVCWGFIESSAMAIHDLSGSICDSSR